MTDLNARIDALAATPADSSDVDDARAAALDLLAALEAGDIRAAERGDDGVWRANAWVKRGILLALRLGRMTDQTAGPFAFFDKDTMPPQSFSIERGVRIVPGGSSIRRGAYVAPGVVCMPPMYVNVGRAGVNEAGERAPNPWRMRTRPVGSDRAASAQMCNTHQGAATDNPIARAPAQPWTSLTPPASCSA